MFILDLDVHTHDYPERKQELASVCRHWRDVILQTPCFWSTIYVASDISLISINTHLERSHGTLLDIVIEGSTFYPPSELLALLPSLDIIKACAHRWHSLLVVDIDYCSDESDNNLEEEGEHLLTNFIAYCMNHLHFPSLNSVTISQHCDFAYLDFLSMARAPALEHLELAGFMTVRDTLHPVAILKTLKLNFDEGPPTDHLSFWSLVPTQALTKLSLSWETKFSLQPNSLSLPSLMSLEILCVKRTRPILDAIVAPNLEQFKCTSTYFDDSPRVLLSRFRSKFANVRQLSFSRLEGASALYHDDVMRFCEAFPGVHHVELDGKNWPHLFDPPPIQTVPGLDYHIRYPVDLWTELKSLTLNGLHSTWVDGDQLVAWLVHRRASSLQQLHVKVKPSDSKVVQYIDRGSILLDERLKENCILELDGFSSRGVRSFHKTSNGVSFSIHRG